MFHFYTQKIIFLILSMVSMYIVLTMVNQQTDMETNWFQPNEIKINSKTIQVNTHEFIMSKSIVPIVKSHTNEKIIGHSSIQNEINSIIHLCSTYSNDIDRPTILEPPNGILLYGPPGTGKTTLGKLIASKLNKKCTFLHISPDNIENKYYGEGLKQLTAIFTLAKKIKPCVIFFDEIDGYMSKRSSLDQSHTNTMKTSLLTLLDSLQNEWNILFIATTNRKDSLDPALLRRLDIQLSMGLPSKEDKCIYISRFIHVNKNDSLMKKNEIEQFISDFTIDMSLCDIKNFCKFCLRQYIPTQKEKMTKTMKMNIEYTTFMNYYNQYINLRYND